MTLYRHHSATRDIKSIGRSNKAADLGVRAFETLLQQDGPALGSRYQGHGCTRDGVPAAIYKARVPYAGQGKSSGLRYIYEYAIVAGAEIIITLLVYSHTTYQHEHQVVSAMQRRFSDIDLSPQGLEDLDRCD